VEGHTGRRAALTLRRTGVFLPPHSIPAVCEAIFCPIKKPRNSFRTQKMWVEYDVEGAADLGERDSEGL
jgi:hypothetical protein